jgi:hypothetical protein
MRPSAPPVTDKHSVPKLRTTSSSQRSTIRVTIKTAAPSRSQSPPTNRFLSEASKTEAEKTIALNLASSPSSIQSTLCVPKSTSGWRWHVTSQRGSNQFPTRVLIETSTHQQPVRGSKITALTTLVQRCYLSAINKFESETKSTQNIKCCYFFLRPMIRLAANSNSITCSTTQLTKLC